MLQLVEAERSGEAVNRYLLKHTVAMLTNLRLYEDGARDMLLSSAIQYYNREGSSLINVRQGMWWGCISHLRCWLCLLHILRHIGSL